MSHTTETPDMNLWQDGLLMKRALQHDAWATRTLLQIADRLSHEQFHRDMDIGHRTIGQTFSHIVRNMECWTDLMLGVDVRPRPTDEPTVETLLSRMDAILPQLLTLAETITHQSRMNECFVDQLDSPPRFKSYGATFLHLVTHGAHHRAQLLYMMRRIGIQELPECDSLAWERMMMASQVTSFAD